ncbi:MAG: bifunctional riboflavin kinase/FAD synthetase [Candidatus Dadabacteria bacterium]|nr:MAG: bifunctional riboflavin kinase/FAD synthetase [Candidatus Dadabacteria bacterium]
MRLYRNRLPEKDPATSFVATLGNFDGLHIGHQHLIAELKKEAAKNNAKSMLISFYPHPQLKLGRIKDFNYLTNLRQKVRILRENGLDLFVLLHFTERLSKLSAREFIENILFSRLGVTALILGPDARMGHKREADITAIRNITIEHGKNLRIVPFLELAGKPVSSRRIRELVLSGDLELAAKLLGRPYCVGGRIRRGDARGSTLGFPTANIHYLSQALPPNGVYISTTVLDGKSYQSVTNIGTRPTFDGSNKTVEVHILNLDNSNELYGKYVDNNLIRKLREEKKFQSVEQLKRQISIDVEKARGFFNEPNE